MRTYTVEFKGVSVSALQDLLAVYTGTSQAIECHGIVIGQITGVTIANLAISLKRFSGGFTPGSGGTTPTPVPMESGDAASTVNSAHANDTTQCTGGTAKVVFADVFNTINGYQLFFPIADRPSFGISQACVLSLDTAPTAMTVSGTLFFAERV